MEVLHEFWRRLKRSADRFGELDPLSEASSLAFTTIFAIPGVFILALMVASTFYDPGEVQRALYTQAGGLVGASTAHDLEEMVGNARRPASGLLARIVGVAALVISATTAFASLQRSLNKIWRVERRPGRAVLRYLVTRLTSLALIASFGFLIMVSLILDTVLVAIGERMGAWLPGSAWLLGVTGLLISLGVVVLLFALVFKYLPDVRVPWRAVWTGAMFTAALFTIGKFLIGLYIAKTGAGDTYGAGGAVVIIMLWVYYSSILMLFGAQYTQVAATDRGRSVMPAPHARFKEECEPEPAPAKMKEREVKATSSS